MIEVKQVHKSFGAVVALTDVTATFPHPAVTGLIGPNGCGKSTLLNIVAGFYQPDRGEVFVTDLARRPVSGLPPEARSRLGVGIAFQEPRGFHGFTVEETLRLASLPYGSDCLWRGAWRSMPPVDELAGLALLDRLDLASSRRRAVRDLSYGQRKLLDVVGLVARGCRYLLLDEPFAGVDPRNLTTLVEFLRCLSRDEGKSLIIVSHELDVISDLADELLLMDDGRVVLRGAPHEVTAADGFRRAYLE